MHIHRRFTRFLELALGLGLLLALCACVAPTTITENGGVFPAATGTVRGTPSATPAPHASRIAGEPFYEPVGFNSLPGWSRDSLEGAWPAFLRSCQALRGDPKWRDVCAAARATPKGSGAFRHFFEAQFIPYRLVSAQGRDTGLVTGYYEPLLQGSRTPTRRFTTPLYGVPDDLITVDLGYLYPQLKGMQLRGRLAGHRLVPYPTRAELTHWSGLRGHELVWVDDPIEAFFLQVQGSGRIQIYQNGQAREVIRLAYADQNGRPYQSIGRWLVERGELAPEHVSKTAIEAWARTHPEQLDALLDANPSYVFFKEKPLVDPDRGPEGSLGVPLTAGRSVAVDPRAVPLGAPVYLSTEPSNGSTESIHRLTFAQDTGSAIKSGANSAVRIDLFCGFGATAGLEAGHMRQEGRIWLLLPRGVAPPP